MGSKPGHFTKHLEGCPAPSAEGGECTCPEVTRWPKDTIRSDAELNLWIAGKLEPSVSWDKRQFSYDIQISDGNCWWRPMADALHDYGIQGKQPRDFCNDPACTAMLRKELRKRGFTWRLVCLGDRLRFDVFNTSSVDGLPERIVASRSGEEEGPITAEAFAIAEL